MFCEIKWNLRNTLRFFGVGTDVQDGDGFRTSDDGTLTAPSASVSNIGWYTCIASNTVGESQSRAFVHVAGKKIRNFVRIYANLNEFSKEDWNFSWKFEILQISMKFKGKFKILFLEWYFIRIYANLNEF